MKLLLLFTVLVFSTARLYPQRIELQFSVGQGFSKGGIPLSSYDQIEAGTDFSNRITTVQNRHDTYFSIGQGTRGEARVILYVNDNVGIFTGLSYSTGSQSSKVNYSYPNDLFSQPFSDNTSIKFNTFSAQAGLHFQSQEGSLQPFAAIGAGYFFQTTFTSTEDYNITHTETQMKTNAPIGYVSSVGINWRINPNISFFVVAKATLVTYYITRKEITDYRYNGISQLSSWPTSQRITVYDEDKNYATSSTNDMNLPRFGGPPNPAPASTLAIIGGFSFTL